MNTPAENNGDIPPLVVLDVANYYFRAFHSGPPRNHNGKPTNATYNLINMLRLAMKNLPQATWLAAHDPPGPGFRHEIAADYKATRKPMPDELRVQLDDIRDALTALGCVSLEIPKVEADDIIASVAKQASPRQVIVLSTDKDLAQLVDQRVYMYDAKSSTALKRQQIFAKYGVYPEQIADYLALVGDSSDNIKGVDGIGAKGAAQLLGEYGTLDNILSNIDQFKGKRRENLEHAAANHLDQTRRLIALRDDLDLQVDLHDPVITDCDSGLLYDLAVRLGFPRLQSEFAPVQQTPVSKQAIIAEPDRWQAAAEDLLKCRRLAVAPHLSDSDPMQATLLGLAFNKGQEPESEPNADPRQAGVYAGAALTDRDLLDPLKPWLADPQNTLIAYDAKALLKVFTRYDLHEGREILCGVECVMLASYCLNSSVRTNQLSAIVNHWCEDAGAEFAGVYEFNRSKYQQAASPLEAQQEAARLATGYATEAAAIAAAGEALLEQLEKHPHSQAVYRDIEIPTTFALAAMEFVGIKLESEPVVQLESELTRQLATIEQRAYEIAGHEFNLGSPKQIGQVLFEELKLASDRKTAGRRQSTNHETLQRLAPLHELPNVILQHRELDKIRSTYTDSLLKFINPQTGRVHSVFQQALVSTGRLSSQNPNLQNIPVRSETGRRVRDAFRAEPGFVFLALDYSQVELRVMAVCSGDKTMSQALAQGTDLHTTAASQLFDTPLEQVSKDQRSSAKAVVFGLIYGITPEGLSRGLDITRTQAKQLMDAYFSRHPQVQKYMEDTKKQAHSSGYVKTLYGRVIPIPAATSSDYRQRAHGERAAINAPIQGTAADIMKIALSRVHQHLQRGDNSDKARVVLQIHDELILEVRKECVEEVSSQVIGIMEDASDGRVPLTVEAGWAETWGKVR